MLFPSMSLNASRHVDVDYVVPLSRIPSLLIELTSETTETARAAAVPEHIDVEVNIAKEQNPREAGLERRGRPSAYSCPDCGGVLMEDIARELTEVQELDGAARMTAAAQRVRRQSKAIRELMREPTLSTSAAD